MIQRRCKACGKLMVFRIHDDVRKFCSRKCFQKHRYDIAEFCFDGPDMPLLNKDSISDEGYANLVSAIVQRAKADILHFAPGTCDRVSAEKFFLSDTFSALTGLEGEPILRELQEQGRKRKPDARGRKSNARAVQCIETGVVYDSVAKAAKAYKIKASRIHDVLAKRRCKTAGVHWRFVEEE